MTTYKTQGYLGRTADGRRVYLGVQLTRQGGKHATTEHAHIDAIDCVSMMGHWFESRSRRRDFDGGGQCIEAAETIIDPAPGLSLADVRRLAELWRRWHLNDMRAACAHQAPVYDDRGRPDLDATPACPVTGYRYGHAWLVEPVPAEVVAELRELADKLDGTDGLKR